ncbi:hypothetical protein BDY21DRAFT_354140 [Lineolata rhizophorae]|uniref:Uncharacterized protein n=1 Tax=Lineolata rhizophorae TaxID=578093 RepID=A0A6A6NQW1_9PEZI|nr:hypothetical protein BDY21DRAFT_354140 [Lineolata rhizophorae]
MRPITWFLGGYSWSPFCALLCPAVFFPYSVPVSKTELVYQSSREPRLPPISVPRVRRVSNLNAGYAAGHHEVHASTEYSERP